MFSGRCQEGWECKSRENCPAFKAEQKKLEGLTSFSREWLKLVSELKELVCNKEAKKVCYKMPSNTGGLTGWGPAYSLFFSGECKEGWRCKRRENCPEFKSEQTKLDSLPSFSSEWLELLSKLKNLECNEKENGVCCRTQYKIVNGNIVKQVEEFPFIARIHIKTGFGSSAFCGATLIHSNLLITAKHCIEPYWIDNCIDETDCLASEMQKVGDTGDISLLFF